MIIFGGPFRALTLLGIIGALVGVYFGVSGIATAKHAQDSVNRKGADSKSMFHAARLEAGLDKVRAKVGNDGQLLSLDVFPGYLVVDAAAGSENKGRSFRIQEDGKVQELPVNLVGPGKLKDNVFPIDKVDPKVVEKVAVETADREHVGGLNGVTHINIGLLASSGGDAGIAVYTNNDNFWRASLDGSGLSNPSQQARVALDGAEKTANAVESQTAAASSSAGDLSACITAAGTDAAKVAACTK
jgi:hypothetical protein